jgi:ABC-type transport system involved in cytochrome c biogenesis permease component
MRFFAAGGMVLFTWILLASNSTTLRPDQLAEGLFLVIASSCFIYALLAGALHTTDSLGYERREGALGLLFLTDLEGYDVVLGKFVATSIHSVFALVATLPVMAIPILLGGVTVGQFWRMSEVLVVTLVMSLSIGMFWSTVSKDLRDSVLGTLGTMATLMGASYFVEWLVRRATRAAHPGWLSISPFRAFYLALDENRVLAGASEHFSNALFWQLGLGFVSLIAASVILGRHWRTMALWGAEVRTSDSVVSWSAEDPRYFIGWRHIRWQHWLDANPYYWLARVTRPPEILLRWIMVSGTTLAAALLILSLNGPQAAKERFGFVAIAVVGLMHLGVKFIGALASTKNIQDDRNSGALELMIVSGMRPEDVLIGHRMALQRQFFPSAVILSCLNVLLMTRVHLPLNAMGGEFRGAITFWLLAGVFFLWLDLRALYVIGVQQSLKATSPLFAMRGTVMRVLFPGWIAAAFIVGSALASGTPSVLLSGAVFWFMGCIGSMAYLLNKADLDLKEGFNLLAAGLHFDRGEAEMKRTFRRAAEFSYMRQ